MRTRLSAALLQLAIVHVTFPPLLLLIPPPNSRYQRSLLCPTLSNHRRICCPSSLFDLSFSPHSFHPACPLLHDGCIGPEHSRRTALCLPQRPCLCLNIGISHYYTLLYILLFLLNSTFLSPKNLIHAQYERQKSHRPFERF